ncbi:hypothetical protein A176_003503 [Myxococcus hansupus]|uniref:Uncharacterized protein n=1 Tax=Pseudomyxococcus hansupus TaxID=1297742 RepID=A0A0H4WSY5_9BACT|nr:hypothetical protein [Myxococcus hansupus]AKQ66591.1 hypothetical protein A176_003503 [Myxococcus hansupus]
MSSPPRRLTFLPATESSALPRTPRTQDGSVTSALTEQVSAGLAPVLTHAHELTQAPVAPNAGRPPNEGVRNTFNVNVHLEPTSVSTGLDRHALEEALIDLLRDTARRHGLEV